MYQKPKTAKRLYFDVIPRAVDEYFQYLSAYEGQDWDKRLQNPVWHIHFGSPPKIDMPVSFAMLLNLVSASNAQDKSILWGFITAYMPGVTAATHPVLDQLVGYAIRYFEDFVKPSKKFRQPTEAERKALLELDARLAALDPAADAEAIQNEVFAVGNAQGYANLRDWFQALYQVLLGQDQGPRFGSFVALYGIGRTRKLISQALAGSLAA
jgi:lysyl-tRNA synthetase class 1